MIGFHKYVPRSKLSSIIRLTYIVIDQIGLKAGAGGYYLPLPIE